MEDNFSTKAIILRRTPYKERDSRVTVMTESHGLLDLVARGTARQGSKLAGHIEPLTLANIMVVRGRQREYICGAFNADTYPNLRADYDKISAAGEAARIFARVVKPALPDLELFDLWLDYSSALEKADGRYQPELYLAVFQSRLLKILGYGPEIEWGGEKKKEKFLDFKNGKLRGNKPRGTCLKLNPETYLLMVHFWQNKITNIKEINLKEQIVNEYIRASRMYYDYNF